MAEHFKSVPQGSGTPGADQEMTVSANDQPEVAQINAETQQAGINSAVFADQMAAAGATGNIGALGGLVAQQGSAGGQGFQLSPEQIDQSLKSIQQQLINLDTRYRTIGLARDAVQAPSRDPASNIHRDHTKASLAIAMATVRNHMDALTAQQQKLGAAQKAYMDQEHLTTDQWNRLATGLSA